MRAIKRGLGIAAALALLAPAVAAAHPSYRLACHDAGSATPDGAFVTGAPYRVSISRKTQRAIWAHVPTGEFNTPHNGDTVAQVPCLVAETVASDGLYARDSAANGNAVDLPDQQLVGYARRSVRRPLSLRRRHQRLHRQHLPNVHAPGRTVRLHLGQVHDRAEPEPQTDPGAWARA